MPNESYNELSTLNNLTPAYQVHGADNKFTVKAMLPGVKKEDIEVHLDDDTLLIRASTSKDRISKSWNVWQREIAFGTYDLNLALTEDIDKEALKVQLDNGVLIIDLPKRSKNGETKKAKKINIEST